MAFEAGSIKGKMSLDNEPVVEAMRDVRKESEAMKEKLENDGKEAGKAIKEHVGGALESLKEKFGRSSELGELAHTLAGGGVLFAVAEAGALRCSKRWWREYRDSRRNSTPARSVPGK
jgi:hypothetical protein